MSAMSGSNFYAYVLRVFKRTDKSTEVYEAITDACQRMSQRFNFDELSNETSTSDTIAVLGDWRIALESDFESFVSDVVVVDGVDSWPLVKVSKSTFDEMFPNQSATNVDKSKPTHYCIFDGSINLGPVPDSVSYTYRVAYSQETGTIDSGTASVPFTDKYRRALRYFVLHYLNVDLGNAEEASVNKALFEEAFEEATSLERKNTGGVSCVKYRGV